MDEVQTRRLTSSDRELARRMFVMMAGVFEEENEQVCDGYIDRLLNREEFWAIAAFMGDEIVGGLTAHTLPMTRAEASEMLVYDIAVRRDHQRRSVGRQLLTTLREAAADSGIQDVFVAANANDAHAVHFYAALGGVSSSVTHFSFHVTTEAQAHSVGTPGVSYDAMALDRLGRLDLLGKEPP
jgi:aminoglycoside 3-N-acetyltransferase I